MSGSRAVYHYGRQSLNEEDIASVVEALRADIISQGSVLADFERKVANYCGAKHCLAVNSGTAALHVATQALGLGKGDFGWTSAMSFVASANVIRYTGSNVDFVDISPDTFNIELGSLVEKLERCAKTGRLPKALIPVHFAGLSCDMKEIAAVTSKYGISIIEDASQGLGGSYEGRRIGDCRYSDVVCFSLHPVKSITAGEGGLVLTNDEALYNQMVLLRTHGVTRGDGVLSNIGPWHSEMQTEGYNYRITEFQCALARSQLSRLDSFIAKRRHLATRYRERLRKVKHVRLQQVREIGEHAWHMMLVLFDFDTLGRTKHDIYSFFCEHGINLNVHYYPIHLHPFYRSMYEFKEGDFPAAEKYWCDAFTFPLHVELEDADIDFICDCVEKIAA